MRYSSIQRGIGSICLGKRIRRIVTNKGMDLTVNASNLVKAGLGSLAGGDFSVGEFPLESGDGELVEHLGAGGVECGRLAHSTIFGTTNKPPACLGAFFKAS